MERLIAWTFVAGWHLLLGDYCSAVQSVFCSQCWKLNMLWILSIERSMCDHLLRRAIRFLILRGGGVPIWSATSSPYIDLASDPQWETAWLKRPQRRNLVIFQYPYFCFLAYTGITYCRRNNVCWNSVFVQLVFIVTHIFFLISYSAINDVQPCELKHELTLFDTKYKQTQSGIYKTYQLEGSQWCEVLKRDICESVIWNAQLFVLILINSKSTGILPSSRIRVNLTSAIFM